MAKLYPFTQKTAQLLESMPGPGGTHNWLLKAAGGLKHVLDANTCFSFLRLCCDRAVSHREIPDSEIESIIELAYGGSQHPPVNFGRQPVDWPEANQPLIDRVLCEIQPAFDPQKDTKLGPADVLPSLFRSGELVCTGRSTEKALVRPLEATLADADWLQFIVVNPMRELSALNYRGKPSPRCHNNTGLRRHLVAEFDNPNLTKYHQAQLLTQLSKFVPLVLVVDSGGKSLHGWFRVDHLSKRDQVRFFVTGCFLGADPTRWDICGWLRMPGGLRVIENVPSVRQRIVHFNPEPANV